MAAVETGAWLRSGGPVVTSSERAARAVTLAFQRGCRAEGLAAWPAPAVQPWGEFVRELWRKHAGDGRLILNSIQEQSLWAAIIAADRPDAALLEGPLYRISRLAMEAYALLCAYAPGLLDAKARAGWQQDAAAFSRWLTAFEDASRRDQLVSSARLPVEVVEALGNAAANGDRAERAPLLLAGFDRIQPIQRRVFEAWGARAGAAPGQAASQIRFYEASDTKTELTACAIWCANHLAADPAARLLIVTQDAASRRGEMERTLIRHLGEDSLFEFSLGVPLAHVPLVRCALLLLRWLRGPIAENELDWLLACGYAAAPRECSDLQGAMRTLRRRHLEQPDWPLNGFIAQCGAGALPPRWVERMTRAQQQAVDFSRQPRSPLDWAEFAWRLLESLGWPAAGGPSARALSSIEFQAAHRFHQAMETAGTLGFDGRRVSWQEFLAALARVLDDTLFAPESRDAPIQIAGPAESAGLSADAIWFMGANEDAFPPAAPMHPLLPAAVQRQFAMPHATAQLDWELARSITTRLLASAPEVCFSCARTVDRVDSRASRLVAQSAGAPQPLPAELAAPGVPAPLTLVFQDTSRIPFPPGEVKGGATVLTYQSQCPFKAFANFRLAAQTWEPALPSLTPAQRGLLLHAVLHAIWGGPPAGLRLLSDLRGLSDRGSFIADHVRRAFDRQVGKNLRARMPRAYFELEERRLVRLITAWLDYESTRADFTAIQTEDSRTVHVAGLTLDLRLDRIDRLNDGSLLVIDYKSGDVTPRSWDPPRPDDLQLPLYAGFALEDGAELGGLAFAKLRPGDLCFTGRVRDAQTTLLPSLGTRSALARDSLPSGLLTEWKDGIEQLARDFIAGRADVDPREYPETCDRCGLQTLCRIHENPPDIDDGENSEPFASAEVRDE